MKASPNDYWQLFTSRKTSFQGDFVIFVIIFFWGNNQLFYCPELLHRDPPTPNPILREINK